MRGTLGRLRHLSEDPGIIPAYAGNTGVALRWLPGRRDHPRVCGEHRLTCRGEPLRLGSSPRMRGTHQTSVAQSYCRGIIPAYAGNTIKAVDTSGASRDHPRVCGEHICADNLSAVSAGSSPRMRGTLVSILRNHATPRIIPAYAGNTMSRIHRTAGTRDHPRVCGEH